MGALIGFRYDSIIRVASCFSRVCPLRFAQWAHGETRPANRCARVRAKPPLFFCFRWLPLRASVSHAQRVTSWHVAEQRVAIRGLGGTRVAEHQVGERASSGTAARCHGGRPHCVRLRAPLSTGYSRAYLLPHKVEGSPPPRKRSYSAPPSSATHTQNEKSVLSPSPRAIVTGGAPHPPVLESRGRFNSGWIRDDGRKERKNGGGGGRQSEVGVLYSVRSADRTRVLGHVITRKVYDCVRELGGDALEDTVSCRGRGEGIEGRRRGP